MSPELAAFIALVVKEVVSLVLENVRAKPDVTISELRERVRSDIMARSLDEHWLDEAVREADERFNSNGG